MDPAILFRPPPRRLEHLLDQVDHLNSLRTLGLSPQMASGFEEEAYGAMQLLIYYQEWLSPENRMAFARRLAQDGHRGQVGIQRSVKGEIFFQLNFLRMGTFGTGFDDDAVTHQTALIQNPWALTDVQFAYCIFTLREGKDPDPEKFEKLYLNDQARKVVKKVEDKLFKDGLKYLEAGVAAYGGKVVGTILKIKNFTWVGLALDLIKDYLMEILQKYSRQLLLARYEVDEVRREYLAGQGLSSYKRMDPPKI